MLSCSQLSDELLVVADGGVHKSVLQGRSGDLRRDAASVMAGVTEFIYLPLIIVVPSGTITPFKQDNASSFGALGRCINAKVQVMTSVVAAVAVWSSDMFFVNSTGRKTRVSRDNAGFNTFRRLNEDENDLQGT